ncbi:MAG: DUF3795 domain-containing protein [Chitinivibrionales bacterium]|nr:DUF3795 domain-containing protein [Chitinivibrionales bacterium]
MEQTLAYCGLLCNECPAFIATKTNDNEKRKTVAAEWSKLFQVNLQSDEINCVGCLSKKEPLFNHCKVCEIRSCSQNKELDNCAGCSDYPCSKLDFIFKSEPAAQKRLDTIHLKMKR